MNEQMNQVMKDGIRHRFPEWTDAQVQREFVRRRLLSYDLTDEVRQEIMSRRDARYPEGRRDA